MVGAVIVYLFQQRRKQLREITADDFPEFDSKSYNQFIILLKTAYERTLYLGVAFFPLAWSARLDGNSGGKITQYFFLSVIALLFLSNIFPRNAVMRLLAEHGLDMEAIRKRGITL